MGVVRSSSDGGASWSSATQLTPNANAGVTRYYSTGICVLQSGRILYAYGEETAGSPNIGSAMAVRASDDGGANWDTAVALPEFDVSTAAGSQSLFQASSGRVYCTVFGWDTGETTSRYKAGIVYSDDDGDTWSGPVDATPANNVHRWNESTLIEKPNGDLVMFVRSELTSPTDMWRTVSTDDGATWSTIARLNIVARPGLPTACLFPDSQTLLLIYRWANFGTPTDFRVVYRWSDDYGDTWTGELSLGSLPSEYAGAVSVDGDRIAVVYAEDNAIGQDTANPGQANLRYVEMVYDPGG